MPLSMIATSTDRRGALPASSSCIARSELMPGTWSADSSSSCQFRGASASLTAGTSVATGATTGLRRCRRRSDGCDGGRRAAGNQCERGSKNK